MIPRRRCPTRQKLPRFRERLCAVWESSLWATVAGSDSSPEAAARRMTTGPESLVDLNPANGEPLAVPIETARTVAWSEIVTSEPAALVGTACSDETDTEMPNKVHKPKPADWTIAAAWETLCRASAALASAALTSPALTSAELASPALTSAELASAALAWAELALAELASAKLASAGSASTGLVPAKLASAKLALVELALAAGLASSGLASA